MTVASVRSVGNVKRIFDSSESSWELCRSFIHVCVFLSLLAEVNVQNHEYNVSDNGQTSRMK